LSVVNGKIYDVNMLLNHQCGLFHKKLS